MSMTDKLLDRLHLVRQSKYDIVREGMHKNGELCADLVEECQSQGKIIDELSDENAKLKEQLAKAGEDIAQWEESYDILRHRLLHLSEAMASIHNITEECDDYAEMV